MLELNVKEINRRYEAEKQEKMTLEKTLTEAETKISTLEDSKQKLKQKKRELQLKLESSNVKSEERDKFMEEMEQRMLSKLAKADEKEKELNKKLNLSINSQSKMEAQLLQLRGDRTNLEHDKQETFGALDKANSVISKLQLNNSYLSSEIDMLKAAKDKLQKKNDKDSKDLREAYEYVGLLEESDVRLRTAVALVNKQNKALVGINGKLKAQLGEAQAQLAMHQFYNDDDEDLEGDIELLSTALREDIDEENSRNNSIPDAPPLMDISDAPVKSMETEISDLLASIPNYVATKRKQREEMLEEDANPAEMADIFAKALLQRRDRIADDVSDSEFSSDDEDEWEE